MLLGQGVAGVAAAREVGVSVATVTKWVKLSHMTLKVSRHGGLGPALEVPVRPVRAPSHGNRLELEDRIVIQIRVREGWSHAAIGREIGAHPATVGRELARNTVEGQYWARLGQQRADQARARPRIPKLDSNPVLRTAVIEGLNNHFSPRQISQRLRRDHPNRHDMQVSHETIYQALYVQGKGALRQELRVEQALRSGRTHRLPTSRLPRRASRPWLAGCLISQRPAEAADRTVPGHWEGDLIIGAHHQSALITLVERSSRFTLIRRVSTGWAATTIADDLTAMMGDLPQVLKRSLTWDQGPEMSEHARFTLSTQIKVFFCDPRSPWQRGTNENTNGLIRQFHPKGTDFRQVTDAQIADTEYYLNIRPRQVLDWANPAEKLNELLTLHALTG